MSQHHRESSMGVVGAGIAVCLIGLLALPQHASAASESTSSKRGVSIQDTTKARTVQGPVQVVARAKGTPRKVTIWLDRQRLQVSFAPPFRIGSDGALDTSGLGFGRHEVVVRAYYGLGVRNKRIARATIRVLRSGTRASDAPARRVVTVLPAVAAPTAGTPVAVPRSAAAWDGSADRGFGPWALVQDGTRDSQWGDTLAQIVPSPAMSGHSAFRFQVNGRTAPNGVRAELADGYRLTEGSEWWFGDVLYLPSSPNASVGWADSNHTVMQWHQDGSGSPPLLLDLREWRNSGSGLGVQDSSGWHSLLPFSALYDRPVPIEVRIRFSSNPNVGNYEIWANNQRVRGPVSAQTLMPGLTSGLKEGQYGEGRGNVVFWQGAKRGATRDSVMR